MLNVADPIAGFHTTDDNWSVLICLLGNFRVLAGGKCLPLRGAQKARALLSSLALGPRFSASRDALLEALWPDAQRSLAGQSLNSLVYSLHRLLKPWLGGHAPVLYENDYYRLDTEAGIDVDVAVFERWAKIGDYESQSGKLASSILAYSRAIELYGGDLTVVTDVQTVVARERLRATYLSILSRLADVYYAEGNYSTCLAYAHRLLSQDACREDAHRMVMRCHVQMGERTQALRQYRICEQVLRAEFGAVPEQATQLLFQQIRCSPAGS